MASNKKRTMKDFFKFKDQLIPAPVPSAAPGQETEFNSDVSSSGIEVQNKGIVSVSETSITPPATPMHFKFLPKWKKEFPWVTFDEELNKMFCSLCQKHNMKVGMATTGSSCFQKSTLLRHEKCTEHKFAQSTKKEAVVMKKAIDKANEEITEGELTVFKTVYMMAKEEIPNSKFKPLMMLHKSCGNSAVKEENMNLHHKSISEIQLAMSELLESSLDDDIRQSPYISILLDESTDIAVDHKLVIYVRYMKNDEPKTTLWTNVKLTGECNAYTLKETVIDFLKQKRIPVSKVVAIATDGAPVMMGKHNGLGKLLQDIIPFLLHYHCIAHRLALAISQAAAGISLFDRSQGTLSSLYAYFHTSTIRSEKLKLMQDILEERNICLKEIHSVRWLSLGRAVEACHLSYDAIVWTLNDIIEAKRNSNPSDKAKAQGLLKHCIHYSFVAALCLLRDVLSIIDRLSKIFQSDDINFSTVINQLYSTIDRIKGMKDGTMPGAHMSEFVECMNDKDGHFHDIKLSVRATSKKDFENAKVKFLDALLTNLNDRFNLEKMKLLSDFDSLLNPNCISKGPKLDSLKNIIAHFCNASSSAVGLVEHELREEFWHIQSLLARCDGMNMKYFCKLVITSKADKEFLYPQFLKLAQIALVIPLSTAACERGFSTQNRIRSVKRNRLSEKHVDTLMRLSETGPQFIEKKW